VTALRRELARELAADPRPDAVITASFPPKSFIALSLLGPLRPAESLAIGTPGAETMVSCGSLATNRARS